MFTQLCCAGIVELWFLWPGSSSNIQLCVTCCGCNPTTSLWLPARSAVTDAILHINVIEICVRFLLKSVCILGVTSWFSKENLWWLLQHIFIGICRYVVQETALKQWIYCIRLCLISLLFWSRVKWLSKSKLWGNCQTRKDWKEHVIKDSRKYIS